jgi:hypothetical protein
MVVDLALVRLHRIRLLTKTVTFGSEQLHTVAVCPPETLSRNVLGVTNGTAQGKLPPARRTYLLLS